MCPCLLGGAQGSSSSWLTCSYFHFFWAPQEHPEHASWFTVPARTLGLQLTGGQVCMDPRLHQWMPVAVQGISGVSSSLWTWLPWGSLPSLGLGLLGWKDPSSSPHAPLSYCVTGCERGPSCMWHEKIGLPHRFITWVFSVKTNVLQTSPLVDNVLVVFTVWENILWS